MFGRSLSSVIVLCGAAVVLSSAHAQSKPPRSLPVIKAETNIVAGKKLNGPASEYKPDKDPNTIEIVDLPDSDTGPNRVSADGQVIFVHDRKQMKIKETKKLMDEAFGILFARENGAR